MGAGARSATGSTPDPPRRSAVLSPTVNAASAARKILDDDDFIAGLTKIIRKTVRDYCSVGKKSELDC